VLRPPAAALPEPAGVAPEAAGEEGRAEGARPAGTRHRGGLEGVVAARWSITWPEVPLSSSVVVAALSSAELRPVETVTWAREESSSGPFTRCSLTGFPGLTCLGWLITPMVTPAPRCCLLACKLSLEWRELTGVALQGVGFGGSPSGGRSVVTTRPSVASLVGREATDLFLPGPPGLFFFGRPIVGPTGGFVTSLAFAC
jgi:hypothetical protein